MKFKTNKINIVFLILIVLIPILALAQVNTVEFGKKLASERLGKNMARKDVAMRLNLKESIIGDIENGKLLYDGGILHKLKRIFPSL